jgi:hypothetical protein
VGCSEVIKILVEQYDLKIMLLKNIIAERARAMTQQVDNEFSSIE